MWLRQLRRSGTCRNDPLAGAHSLSISALPPNFKLQPTLAFVAAPLLQRISKHVLRLADGERHAFRILLGACFLYFVPAAATQGRELHRQSDVDRWHP